MSSGIDVAGAAKVADREEEGVLVQIRDPQGEPAMVGDQPVTVRIAGSYSKRYRRIQEGQTQRMLKRRQVALTAEQLTANRVELVAGCILDWSGFTNGGQPYPFSRDNATHLVTVAPWIRDQLEEAQGDHASFSASSSAT